MAISTERAGLSPLDHARARSWGHLCGEALPARGRLQTCARSHTYMPWTVDLCHGPREGNLGDYSAVCMRSRTAQVLVMAVPRWALVELCTGCHRYTQA